jgi:hypothetical protein
MVFGCGVAALCSLWRNNFKISSGYILALYFIFSVFSAISAVKILAGRNHGAES